MLNTYRRHTAPPSYVQEENAHNAASVRHIHDVVPQPQRYANGGIMARPRLSGSPTRTRPPSVATIRRLSQPKKKQFYTLDSAGGYQPSGGGGGVALATGGAFWQHTLRTGRYSGRRTTLCSPKEHSSADGASGDNTIDIDSMLNKDTDNAADNERDIGLLLNDVPAPIKDGSVLVAPPTSLFIFAEAEEKVDVAPCAESDSEMDSVALRVHETEAEEKKVAEALKAEQLACAKRTAALSALARLFLPLWRLHRHRVKCMLALNRSSGLRHVPRFVHVWEKRSACAVMVKVLRTAPLVWLREGVRALAAKVILIQRVYRRHRARVESGVTLNLLRIRRSGEAAYWAQVVAEREAELLALEACSPLMTALENIVEAEREQPQKQRQRGGLLRGQQSPLKPTAGTIKAQNGAVPRRSYELDVYNYYLAGPLPELLLRAELRTALLAKVRHAARDACETDQLRATSRCPPASSTPTARSVRTSSFALFGSAGSDKRAKRLFLPRRPPIHFPVFLSEASVTAVLNNTCFVASCFQDCPALRAHLKKRGRRLSSY